eukprot:3949835-Heterocapsa_arctica.AAC.1
MILTAMAAVLCWAGNPPADLNIDTINLKHCEDQVKTCFNMALHARIGGCENGLIDTEFELGLLYDS